MRDDIENRLKQRLGIEDDESDGVISDAAGWAEDVIREYCHIRRVPCGARHIWFSIAYDMARELFGMADGQETGSSEAIKEIQLGDSRLSFRDSYRKQFREEIIFNYGRQLNLFRKVRML